jgi:hypothetical protein
MLRSSKMFILCLTTLIFMSSALLAAAGDQPISQEGRSLSLNGTAFQDLNRDGFLSADEPGLAGWTVRLTRNGTEISSAVTDERGRYLFSNLAPGLYELREDPVQGWNQTSPGGGFYQVRLTDKPALGLDFGDFLPSKVAAAPPVVEHPIMQPTPEMANLWMEQYDATPGAYLSPALAAELAEAPGASYSLLDYLQYTPAERNQGSCGNCWAWAGTGVMEIDYARQKGVKDRFSVQYLDSNFNGGCGSLGACCGGWLPNLATFYSGTGMIVPWSNANAQYQDGSRSCKGCSAVYRSSISTNPHYSLATIAPRTIPTIGVGKETAISNIKNVLVQGKAIWFGFFLPDKNAWSNFKSFWDAQGESVVWQPDFACGSQYDYTNGGGHAVLCVGYDDTDPNNRYWIMLNSWGSSDLRPGGLFRVNMDMNYDCGYGGLGNAFYWMTLDISYPESRDGAPDISLQPFGPSTGYVDQNLSNTSTLVSDGDDVENTSVLGGEITSEIDSVMSLAKASATHTWQRSATNRVRARDGRDEKSPRSPSLGVRISRATSGASKKPTAPDEVKRRINVGRAYCSM